MTSDTRRNVEDNHDCRIFVSSKDNRLNQRGRDILSLLGLKEDEQRKRVLKFMDTYHAGLNVFRVEFFRIDKNTKTTLSKGNIGSVYGVLSAGDCSYYFTPRNENDFIFVPNDARKYI